MNIRIYDFINPKKSDSDIIDECILKLNTDIENTLIFDHKTWVIDRAILLPSNTTVIIDNCTIKQTDKTYDNIFRGNNLTLDESGVFPDDITPISNIKIIGKGNAILEGPDKNRTMFHPVLQEVQEVVGDFYGWRTHQISFTMISGCEISGLSIIKTRGWAICFDISNNIHISDINFKTNVKNGDGIDFRSGTNHCLVERITGYTSDDTVACTALAKTTLGGKDLYPVKNYLFPNEPGNCYIKNRTSNEMDVHDIVIRDINTHGKHHGIICLASNGSKVYNVKIENFTEPRDEWREATVKIYTGYGNGYTKGDIHDIHVKNIYSSYADYAIYCNAEVENVTFENINHIDSDKKMRLDFPENIKIL